MGAISHRYATARTAWIVHYRWWAAKSVDFILKFYLIYEEEWLLLNYYLSTCLSCGFVLTWCCTLTSVTKILVRAISNVHAGRRFPTPSLDRNPIFYSFSRLIAIVANTNAHIYAREEHILTNRMIVRAKNRIPKMCLLLHLWWKATSAPVAPFMKGQRGNAPAMPPFSGVPVHIILHALCLLVVVSCKVSL